MIVREYTRRRGCGRRMLGRMAVGSSVALSLLLTGPVEAGYTVRIDGGVLRVEGDADADRLSVGLRSGNATILEIDVDDNGSVEFAVDRATFGAILIDAGDGDDFVRISEFNGPFTHEHQTTLNGGEGNDTLLGGLGDELLIGGGGDDVIDGNRGNDQVLMGGGDDVFVWDPGDASDIIEGQGGFDRLQFNGSAANELYEFTPNGGRLRFTRNVANIVMDLDGLEEVLLNALGGDDAVTINDLSGTAVEIVVVDLAGTLGGDAGDGRPDSVICNGTGASEMFTATPDGTALHVATPSLRVVVRHGDVGSDRAVINGSGSDQAHANGTNRDDFIQLMPSPVGGARVFVNDAAAALDVVGDAELVVNGLKGDDRITAVEGMAGQGIPLILDGGKGNDTIDGSDGDDLLIGGSGHDVLDGDRGNDLVLGGSGNDTFVWDPGDASDTLEGGNGFDQLRFNGSNVGEILDLSANGGRLRLTRNVANIVMDIDDVELVTCNVLGGADTIDVHDLSATAVKTVHVDLAALLGGESGDTQADTIRLVGTGAAETFTARAEGTSLRVDGAGAEVLLQHADPAVDRALVDGVGSDQLHVMGTNGNDVIELMASPNGGVRAMFEGVPAAVDAAGNASMIVFGLKGADTIRGRNGMAGQGVPLTIDGGKGDDTLLGGDGADLIIGGDGSDFIDGNMGSDLVLMLKGSDVFNWDPGDGSDTVEGGAGFDVMNFNGSNVGELIDLSANGPRLRFTRNVANIVMDLDGVEQVRCNALGGADAVTVGDLTGTAVEIVTLDLAALPGGEQGDAQPDSITIQGTPLPDTIRLSVFGSSVLVNGLRAAVEMRQPEAARDRVTVNGLGGVDNITVNPGVTDLIQVTINE